ncbi:hypothetical protein [Streptomyces sp. NPDC006384]|uniref:hypothetical protein n=1 Tax=Streptomyces sp. NPDC006384 TaxID=3364745 RepID=UPI0036866EE4
MLETRGHDALTLHFSRDPDGPPRLLGLAAAPAAGGLVVSPPDPCPAVLLRLRRTAAALS